MLSPVLAGEQTIKDIMRIGMRKTASSSTSKRRRFKIDRGRRIVYAEDGTCEKYDRLLKVLLVISQMRRRIM